MIWIARVEEIIGSEVLLSKTTKQSYLLLPEFKPYSISLLSR
jgi:hypothetical protein